MYRSVVLLNKTTETAKFIEEMVDHVVSRLQIDVKSKQNIAKILLAEISTFQKTLNNGLKVLEDIITKGNKDKQIT